VPDCAGLPSRSFRSSWAAAVAPSVSIFGSFFPAWLICIVIGVVLTILTRQIFVATKIAPHISPAAIVYPCLTAAWIFATWLLLFQS